MIFNIYNKLKKPLYFIVILGMLLQVSQVANIFTPKTAKAATTTDISSTTSGGNVANTNNILGPAHDGNTTDLTLNSDYVYGSGFSGTGTITQVKIAAKGHWTGTHSNDYVTLSHSKGVISTTNSFQKDTDITVELDITGDLTGNLNWTYLNDLQVRATYTQSGGKDGTTFHIDTLWLILTTVDNTNVYISPTGNDTTGDGTSGNPYLTIQKGINEVIVGGIVNVATGTYTENVNVNKALTLIGASSTTVTVNAAVASTSTINVSANSVSISGFTISGANVSTTAGIYLGDNVTLCNIHDNTLTGNGDGIWLGSGSNHNTLENNILSNNYQGFEVYHSSNNTFTSNNASSNNNYGFKMESASNNTLTGNIASSNLKYGFYLSAGTDGSNNNMLLNNTANLNTQYGIRINDSDGNTLTGNTLNANVLENIKLKGVVTNLSLTGNSFTNSGLGIDIDASVTDVSTWTVNENNISGNTTYNVSNSALAGTLDATNNWWGNEDPNFAVIASGLINHNPWWTTSTGTSSVSATAPTISDISTNDTTPNITWNAVTAYPATDKYQVEITFAGGGTFTSPELITNSYQVPFSLAEGIHSYKIKSHNAPNNYGWSAYSTSKNLVIDTTAPIISGVTEGNYYNINKAPTFNEGTATLNGNPFASGTTISVEGYYTLIATDLAGNSTTRHFTIDKTAPSVTVNSAKTNDQSPVLSGTINDNTAVISVTVNSLVYPAVNNANGTWTLTDNTIIPNLVEGTYNISVSATDLAGNIGIDATIDELMIDITAPSVNAGSDKITKIQVNQDATVNGSISGVQNYTWTKQSGAGTITFGTPNAEDTTISANQEGTYVIRLTVVDNAGNTTYDELNFVWDTTAPTASVSYNPATLTNQNVTATLGNYSENITITNNSGLNTYTFTANGTFTFEFVDDAGNTGSAIATVNWIDKTAPTATVSYNPATLTNQNVTATLGNYSENITITNNGGLNTYTFTANGTFTFNFVDDAGNTGSAIATVNWIDKTPPIITGVTEGVYYNIDKTPTFNEGTAILNSNPFLSGATISAEGYYTLIVTDLAGNISTVHFTIDKTAPTGTINYNPSTATNQNVIATLNPSESVTITNNSGLNTYTFSDNGTFTFNFTDQAGNTGSTIATVNWIDRIAPIGTININSGAIYSNSTNVNLTLSALDSDSGLSQMRFSNDNSVWSSWESYATSKSNWSLSAVEGIKTVYAQYKDNAGNISTSASDTIILDTTAPTANTPFAGSAFSNDTTPTWNWTASADTNGIAGYYIKIGNTSGTANILAETWIGNNILYTPISALSEGIYYLSIKAKDNANNIGAYNTSDSGVTIDTTKPIITGVIEGSYYNTNLTPGFNEGTATLNGNPFLSGATVSDENDYVLIVTDQAGNSTTVNFTIDKTAPTGTIKINDGKTITNSATVTLNLNSSDTSEMSFSNDNSIWSDWETYSDTRTDWILLAGNGTKTVYAKFKDCAGNVSQAYFASIDYNQNATNIEQKNTNTTDLQFAGGQVDISSNVNIGSGTITYAEYSQNPQTAGTFSAFGKYFDISAEGTITFPVMIKIYYTQADLNAANISEEQIQGLYYWDTTSSSWKLYSNTGVNTQDTSVGGIDYAGFVWANADHFTPMTMGADTTNPNKPANFKAEAGDTQIKLTWDKVDDAAGYYIRYREGTNADANKVYTEVYISGAHNTQTTVSGLSNGKMYEFGVRANDASGNKSEWAVVEETPKAGAVIISASETSSLAKQLFGISSAYAAPSESAAETQQEIKTNPESTSDQGEVKSEEEANQTESTRAAVTIGIIIIAIGAALGGYYGYQWWLSREEQNQTTVKPPKKDYSDKDKVKDKSKGKQSRRW